MAISNQEIIQALDVEIEYKEMGINFTAKQPNKAGWMACWPIGKSSGKSPSAGVNVNSGAYVDFSTTKDSLGMFDFSVLHHPNNFADWKEARRYYAKKVGLSKRLPRKEQQEHFKDSFEPKKMNPRMLRGIIKRYPQFSEEAILSCGGQLATFPKKSTQPSWVICFGCYGKDLLDSAPRGYAVISATGHPIMLYKGDDNPPEPMMKFNKGKSGIVGLRTIRDWESVEYVWKVEGLSDVIALENLIPPDERKKHGVITNSSGAGEVELVYEIAPLFSDKKLMVVHDCDQPGQEGAKIWLAATIGIASEAKNVVLPYEIEEKKGKDLRDWITDGGTFKELCKLADEIEPFKDEEVAGDPSTVKIKSTFEGTSLEHQILKKAGCIVLGETEESQTISCFSEHLRKTVRVKSIDRYKYENALQNFGHQFQDNFAPNGTDPNDPKIPFLLFKRALALEASNRQLTDENQLGVGVWKLQDYIFLINKGEIGVYNGKFSRSINPIVGNKILNMGGDEPWYSYDEMDALITKAESGTQWRQDVFQESVNIFELWDNFTHKFCPEILTAMVCCTFVQSIWKWRPYVGLCGPSNSGKTTLMQNILLPMFGKLACFSAKPTEAGLRQQIGYSAKVIMLDEFEADQHRQKVLELLRTSGRGIDLYRGTAGQKGKKFRLHHIPWMGAIEMGIKDAADRNRYLFIPLDHVGSDRVNIESKIPDHETIAEIGRKLCAIAIVCSREATQIIKSLSKEKFDKVDRRVLMSHTLPAAMIAAIRGYSVEDAKDLLNIFLEERADFASIETDEQDVIDEIFSSVVILEKGKRATVAQICHAKEEGIAFQLLDESVDKVLERIGLKFHDNDRGEPSLFFSTKSIRRELLRDTDLRNSDLKTILARIPHAETIRTRFAGTRPRGISIPLTRLSQYMGWNKSKVEYTPEYKADESDSLFEGII